MDETPKKASDEPVGERSEQLTASDDDREWVQAFNLLRWSLVDPHSSPQDLYQERGQKARRFWYQLDIGESRDTRQIILKVYFQDTRADGTWGRFQACHLGFDSLRCSEPEESELLEILTTNAEILRKRSALRRHLSRQGHEARSLVPALLVESLLPRLCATGRFVRREGRPTKKGVNRHPFVWDGGPPWTFALGVELDDTEVGSRQARICGRLRRGEETRAVTEPELLLEGLVLFGETLARFEGKDLFPWIWQLRNDGEICVSEKRLGPMLDELFNLPVLPPVELPSELQLEEVQVEPRPCLKILAPRLPKNPEARLPKDLEAELRFEYGDLRVHGTDDRACLVDRAKGRLFRRQRKAEEDAVDHLLAVGCQWAQDSDFEIDVKKFPDLVLQLVVDGWLVEAEGRLVRAPAGLRFSIAFGIEWLELSGTAEFEGVGLLLPELLGAVKKKERLVRLGDGTLGILPQEWLECCHPLLLLGDFEDDLCRFLPSQAFLLEVLLEQVAEVDVDEPFRRLRKTLRSFQGIEGRNPPRGFVGELRPYQQEGLGWLEFLAGLGFGGCLADDMGLGKTVQVLALLAGRRDEGVPSLVVVPRSLVQNWLDEAARFAPQLRVLAYRGAGRSVWRDTLGEYDVVVTTYGTLRRDIEELVEVTFDYAVLDEAQAIKNAASQTARACRRLRARHRLALTGTPVENHLGELWSLFAFLNPGMLGRVPSLEGLLGETDLDDEELALLAQVLRPFILRRTKEAVLHDLPPKSEAVLFCELSPHEEQRYTELRDYFSNSLKQRMEEVGLNRSKIHIIEALLRLRQASCHPGLIDAAHGHERSAKLEVLFSHLRELLPAGHKALIFSQFTSFLALVRKRLERLKIPFEYLDGKTSNRQERVEHFQSDPHCPLFLISLKAGGVGLNLTAADYVFLLDPWWNPAVEAQAIDRAHRIGQKRSVLAYRLIARGTVEEKILELQAKKQALAESILSADQGLIREMTAEDLRWLLQ